MFGSVLSLPVFVVVMIEPLNFSAVSPRPFLLAQRKRIKLELFLFSEGERSAPSKVEQKSALIAASAILDWSRCETK
jgi:hypothetical protein